METGGVFITSKGTILEVVVKFCSATVGCLRNWVGMLMRVGHRSVLIAGLLRAWLSTLFKCASS